MELIQSNSGTFSCRSHEVLTDGQYTSGHVGYGETSKEALVNLYLALLEHQHEVAVALNLVAARIANEK